MADLPAIEYPDVELPTEWRATVAALRERAVVVERWGDELIARSRVALRAHEDAFLVLDTLLGQGRQGEAHTVIRDVANQVRVGRGQAAPRLDG